MNSLKEREREEQCNNTPILGKIWKPCADDEDSWQLYQFVVDLIQYFFTVNKKVSCNSLNSMLYNSIIHPLSIRKIAFSEINLFYFF